jgi:hypothetical protein
MEWWQWVGECILPDKNALKIEVLKEAHESKFVVHPGNTKMYRDLKEFYWSSNIKKEMVEYMAKCVVCQQVKVEH